MIHAPSPTSPPDGIRPFQDAVDQLLAREFELASCSTLELDPADRDGWVDRVFDAVWRRVRPPHGFLLVLGYRPGAAADRDSLRRVDLFGSLHRRPTRCSREGACRDALSRPGADPGDALHDAYLIDSGSVTILRDTPYGQYTLAELGTGDLFGETAFIDHKERSTNALAKGDTELIAFRLESLERLFEADRKLALGLYWAFWKSLSKKLRATNTHLTGFFAETGRSGGAELSAARERDPSFRLSVADKRKLFEEQKLSGLEINFLASLSQERKFEPGQPIFREGDPGEEMFVVLDGRVMISKYIAGAGEEALAFLERGDYFGEMALIDRQPRSADAAADQGGAVVLAIPREVLSGILDIQKLSSLRLLKILCSLVAKRLRELDDKLVGWFILAGGGVSNR
ncbi:MAG: cyclic nucleotide-binding domain-containing protein [Solirubrobacterales bacterium]